MARRLGYLHETIALAARYRRCRAAWQAHLQCTRRALLDAAEACERRRSALILGSGHLLDVPLGDLAARFQNVILVDVLHPPSARRQARRYANVRLLEHDLTECLATMLALPADSDAAAIAALAQRQPCRFVQDDEIDWVASVNVLSQLPLLPAQWLQRHFPQYTDSLFNPWALALMQRHLDYLRRFDADICLVADVEQISRDCRSKLLAHTDFTASLFAGLVPADQWWWDIAPPGELAEGNSTRHRVWALQWRNGPARASNDAA